MADSDEIFLALDVPLKQAAEQVAAVLGLEPDEVQAMDGYGVVVDIQSRQRKQAQPDESRLAFEALTGALPDVPALLSHNVEMLIASYLPGSGTHTFEPGTTLDDPDIDTWRPWVVG